MSCNVSHSERAQVYEHPCIFFNSDFADGSTTVFVYDYIVQGYCLSSVRCSFAFLFFNFQVRCRSQQCQPNPEGHYVRLWWYRGSVLPLSTGVRGFKPGRSRQDFSGRKNPQHAFLRKGSKAMGPMSQICGM